MFIYLTDLRDVGVAINVHHIQHVFPAGEGAVVSFGGKEAGQIGVRESYANVLALIKKAIE